MQLKSLTLHNFRNHHCFTVECLSNVLIIVGGNARGKTNIIEALQLISMHESFRHPKTEELRSWSVPNQSPNQSPTSIDITLLKNQETHTKTFRLFEEKKTYLFNNKERPSRELLEILPSVLFTPDDLLMIKNAPENRRDFLDSIGTRLSRTFASIRGEYQKALKQKNRLLKEEMVDLELLRSWNLHLAGLGASLIKHRKGLLEQLMDVAIPAYKEISHREEFSGYYKESTQENLEEALHVFQNEEIAAKRALYGPHKDDILFRIDGQDARRFGSQGQQRSAVLALKVAENTVLQRITGARPLLLLDDVMSELDEARRKALLALIEKAGQTIITTTNLGYFEEAFLDKAQVVTL